jgi:hypothetical protein
MKIGRFVDVNFFIQFEIRHTQLALCNSTSSAIDGNASREATMAPQAAGEAAATAEAAQAAASAVKGNRVKAG